MQFLPSSRHQEALLYQKLQNKTVRCHLCSHYCLIDSGKWGTCKVRQNQDGTLYTHVYGQTVAQNIDLIEKKPLFHFYPGSSTYSLSTNGCNFHCQYCINWEISQKSSANIENNEKTDGLPQDIVSAALRANCQSIAYTYVEPTIFFEYILDISRLAQKAGLFNVFKTNGFMTSEMLTLSKPYIDAANVDLKTFRDETYRQFGGRLQPVLDNLRYMKAQGIWLEVTTVIIPGINDEAEELEAIATFIAQELGCDTPWHITRFFPAHLMKDYPLTPVETMHKAHKIGVGAGLHYVYFGNLLQSGHQDTHCSGCHQTLIERRGFRLLNHKVQNNACTNCGTPVSLIGMHEVKRKKVSTEGKTNG